MLKQKKWLKMNQTVLNSWIIDYVIGKYIKTSRTNVSTNKYIHGMLISLSIIDSQTSTYIKS